MVLGSCPDGAGGGRLGGRPGGIEDFCDADSAASPIGGGIGFLSDADFAPAIPFPPVPSLDRVGFALLVALLLGAGAAGVARGSPGQGRERAQ